MERFTDLLRGTSNKDKGADTDIEMGEADPNQSPFMQEFFDKISQVKRNMDQIRKNMGHMEKQHGMALTSVSSTASNKRQEEIEGLMDQTSTLITAVKVALKDMDKDSKAHAAKAGKAGDGEARIRQNMHSALTKKFIALVQEYQEMQTNFKGKYKERVGRQLKVVRPDATDEDVERLLQDGGDGNIFKQQLLQERSTQAAKNALADIQDKHKDILRLEQSIVELHQLFVDMAVLVETQGEMLDQIEYSVQQAHQYVDRGVKQLEKAKESQKKSRKRMCCLLCCFIIILFVVIGVVFGGLKGAKIV
uniref:t-SNARE coiled-coil homology domain-containing protein n=1 Tax=Hanusia phi TaxID=3032 RepID=A0A7S0NG74_9CRYP|mmetsp:Transcript_9739/g.22204  ORF Transcript_9739/g.22204 Transcript_9739/m.22204 type:complete len:306 (+) Transcript_9739:491-1408(+)